ncbi:MAG: 2-hydroxyacid dehydrogenase [Lachnospiraceae bacterium]|nr:2-hydroxyacid dehydrogenase [Lachnospiraceae bacterium]
MKILFFNAKPYDKIWFKPLAEQMNYQIKFRSVRLDEDSAGLAKGYDAICAFVNDDLNKNVINELIDAGIKGILMRCAGYNNVDLEAAKGKLKILRVPSYSPEAVAEFAMAQILTVNRQTHRAYVRIRDFNMNINGLMGENLYQKTIGIVGTGRIGQAMIRICRGFGMRILAYDLYPNKSLDVEYVKLEQLFRESDIISLHCPLTDDSRYMINEDSLKLMKDGVYIMNTSRGELIRTEDLLEALRVPGKIGGVGLDVYEEEEELFYEDRSNEIMTDDMLARLVTFPNVLVTSHQGYFTKEAMQEIAHVTMENAKALEEGRDNGNEVISS